MAMRIPTVDSEDVQDLIVEIEDAFDFRFADDAFAQATTIGDLFEVVWSALPETTRRGGKCPTLVCWFVARNWLTKHSPAGRIVPATPLAGLGGFSYTDMERELQRQDWHMPPRRVQPATWSLAGLLTVEVSLCLLLALGPGALLMAPVWFAAIGWALHRHVFRSGLPNLVSVGDLAREMSGLNIKKLRGLGATFNRRNMWSMFENALADAPVPLSPDVRLA